MHQRLAVLHLALGQVFQGAQFALAGAHAARAHALVAQQVLGHRPAFVLFKHQVLDRHLDVIKEDLVHLVAAVHQDQGAHRDAGRGHVHQQKADAFLALLGLAVGAHQAEDPVPVVAECGPDLLAVDDVVVALALGPGFDGGQVGACAGFGIALHPEVNAIADAGQKALFLRRRAKAVQDRRAHGRAKRWQIGRARQAKDFLVDVALGNVPTRAAPFHGPMRDRPALGRQNFVPAHEVVFGQVLVVHDLVANVSGQVGVQPVAHFVAKGQFLGAVTQVHGVVLVQGFDSSSRGSSAQFSTATPVRTVCLVTRQAPLKTL